MSARIQAAWAGAGALFLVDLLTPLLVIAFGNELAGEATHP